MRWSCWDSGLDAEFCREVLYSNAAISGGEDYYHGDGWQSKWLHEVMQFNVQAVVPRDSDAETFCPALNAVARGMMFLPGIGYNSTESWSPVI